MPAAIVLLVGPFEGGPFGYWGNIAEELAAFIVPAALAAWWTRGQATVAITIGLGVTWGPVLMFGWIGALREDRSLVPALGVSCYVGTALALTWFMGRFRRP